MNTSPATHTTLRSTNKASHADRVLKNGKQLDGSHTSTRSEAGSNGIVAFGWAVVVLMISARSVVGRNASVRQGVGGGYYLKNTWPWGYERYSQMTMEMETMLM
jgi:hypothetical protein